jgi:DNA-binding Xre family transcriptional regulator
MTGKARRQTEPAPPAPAIHWHLRQIMATRGMFSTTDLIPGLTERGIELSREQIYRLVTRTPERLNTRVLAALCDLLDCAVGELIEPVTTTTAANKKPARKRAGAGEQRDAPAALRPTRARIAPVRPVE